MSCALHALKLGLSVIIMDARGIADGATGRNGGHCWPDELLVHPDTCTIDYLDVQTVRKFIATLSQEWQQKIDLRINGGIQSFCNTETGNREFVIRKMSQVK